ncbi:MAG: VanW family protein [Lachnospiraceae bacterium]|nr:VanW family protein [Lachnospiraceae bacterium]
MKLFGKLNAILIGSFALFISVGSVKTAASVDIMAGGAGILDPLSIYSEYAGYLDDLYIEDYAKKAEDEIDIPGNIRDGVYIGDVNVSGMSYRQAVKAVNDYVNTLSDRTITLNSVNDNQSVYTLGELGISWANTDAAVDAISLGKGGNLIAQYKAICDLKNNPKKYDLQLEYDREKVAGVVEAEAEKSNIKPTNAVVERVDGHFQIKSQGNNGVEVNIAKSVSDIIAALDSWDKGELSVNLVTDVTKSNLDEEALSQMTDILGSYTTSFKSSSADRTGNVRTGCKHINGTILYPGEQFSAYGTVSPFTEDNGYFMAGSYLNGMVVESLGGGICQVSSTLYNAVIRAELQVDERSPHSMVVTYVDLSSDAAIAGTYKDFKFTNNTEYPIYIEGYTTEDKKITFNIYGKDTRPSNRSVTFESVETSKTEPEGEKIIADSSHPVGFISTQSAHIGYTGELWKIVKVDGVETERLKINKSTYHPSPRTATVGTGAADANVVATISAAIDSGSIDYVKQTIASLTAAAQAAAALGQ